MLFGVRFASVVCVDLIGPNIVVAGVYIGQGNFSRLFTGTVCPKLARYLLGAEAGTFCALVVEVLNLLYRQRLSFLGSVFIEIFAVTISDVSFVDIFIFTISRVALHVFHSSPNRCGDGLGFCDPVRNFLILSQGFPEIVDPQLLPRLDFQSDCVLDT